MSISKLTKVVLVHLARIAGPFPFIIIFFLLTTTHADSVEPGNEYQLKAAYIYNFLQFIQFGRKPDGHPADTFRVCVVSDQGLPEGFNELSSKQVLGKRIEVFRLTSRQDFTQCHELFHVDPVVSDISTNLSKAAGSGILTIGEGDGFVGTGGMIHFFIKDKKLRFSVNLVKAREGGITISSRILKLAEQVVQ